MSEPGKGLNKEQNDLAEHTEGFVVVDAGPGTGKTHTLVERYVNIIRKNVDPKDILMLTFTRNAAREMEDRISSKLMELSKAPSGDGPSGEDLRKCIKNIKASTFDSVCLNIVLSSPDQVSEFFSVDTTLSRSAKLIENETLNKQYFRNYYAEFANEHGSIYCNKGKNVAAVASDKVDDLYNVICKLMSRGIIPLRDEEWFGSGMTTLSGPVEKLKQDLREKGSDVGKQLSKMTGSPEDYDLPDLGGWDPTMAVPDEIIDDIADGKRDLLFYFIHDVYYEYIKRSISDNRLTFGLTELFAFAILYNNPKNRQHAVDYMMVDEFQDTNELQMQLCTLLLNKPNLCAVGDWKQGIYGFRFVNPENITRFDKRLDATIAMLNRDDERVPFEYSKPFHISLVTNYRSSSLILEKSFRALELRGSKTENVSNAGEIVNLKADRDSEIGKDTSFERVSGTSRDDEVRLVVRKIIEYKRSGKYRIHEFGNDGQTVRDVSYGDMAVLCRESKLCRSILEECRAQHVPAYYQGDLEVMASREGKLVLAWLRYLNNENDPSGQTAILADMKYELSEIRAIVRSNDPDDVDEKEPMPSEIAEQRRRLIKKRRRPNDLVTSIFAFYGLDNDVTQSIISILSSAYRDSLLTISDLIRLIEDDVDSATKYSVDPALDTKAVTIQTMHKSKGLEYPIVIVAGVDDRMLPSTKGDSIIYRFSDKYGLRCTKDYFSRVNDGVSYERIVDSWQWEILKNLSDRDYSEERRLMFVAMSRAKQYLTIASSNRPSLFFTAYEDSALHEVGAYSENGSPDGGDSLQPAPAIAGYSKCRISASVHDLMGTIDPTFDNSSDEVSGKGAKYGTRVHEAAYLMLRNRRYDNTLEEMAEVHRILDGLKGARCTGEVNCVLPMGKLSVKGTIDLLAEFDDRIEIHDYKTDPDKKYLEQYRLQVSIYAYAAGSLGKPVSCSIDFVSLKESEKFDPLPMADVERAAADYINKIGNGTY